MAKKESQKTDKSVDAITHIDATRKNIPTAEYQSVMEKKDKNSLRVAYERRNRDLDPQLVWRGKDDQDWSDLVVNAPPIYIQEKVHPKVLIDDLLNQTKARQKAPEQIDLFSDFNGLPNEEAKTEFYQHDAHWANRMILGDSLQVMASLAEREGLRGKVQCMYFDPPYGINFNSNFQWSTNSRDQKDGNTLHITREPEQVKAFRDTWRDGMHSYLTYIRDRLTVARDLLNDTGSIFVQIGDENVHLVRSIMDEVFGSENFIVMISYSTTGGFNTATLSRAGDYILWYAKKANSIKYRQLYFKKKSPLGDPGNRNDQVELSDLQRRPLTADEKMGTKDIDDVSKIFRYDNLLSQGSAIDKQPFCMYGKTYHPANNCHWKANHPKGMQILLNARRIEVSGNRLVYVRYFNDFAVQPIHNIWTDIGGSVQSRTDPKVYVVQTGSSLIERCLLMATDPGDLVLDPTCGSGTTAYVAEQWGRRWITIDTSRVALALARARIMGARYPYYLLADSRDGQLKEANVTRTAPSSKPVYNNIRHGFVYERVPHITLKSIANNTEIDVIWDKYQAALEPLRESLNKLLTTKWEEWEIPRNAEDKWSKEAKDTHKKWWELRIARQKEIDASIAAKAEFEYLYDKPYEDKKKVRVAGPFTVESLSPHKVLVIDEEDDLVDGIKENQSAYADEQDFIRMILENLKNAGVQQVHKEDKIVFTSLTPWPGTMICAEGRYTETIDGTITEKRAGIFIGPEFGTVTRPDLVEVAREAGEAMFDVVITCAFNYDARSTDFAKLGRIPVLKARMNADLHMGADLRNNGKGNLFVIFGEPDIEIIKTSNDQVQVKIIGVDVFDPNTGSIRSDNADGIACWFVDTDYNEESFFVRQAYFLGANDPYKSLKTSLKAEINQEAWETLHSDTSQPFDKPQSGRIAVKVINHLGDEVMKVYKV